MARFATTMKEARHIEDIGRQLKHGRRVTLLLTHARKLTGWLWGGRCSLNLFAGEVYGGTGFIAEDGTTHAVDYLDIVEVVPPETHEPSYETRRRLHLELADKVPAIEPELPEWVYYAKPGDLGTAGLPVGTRFIFPKQEGADECANYRVVVVAEMPEEAAAPASA